MANLVFSVVLTTLLKASFLPETEPVVVEAADLAEATLRAEPRLDKLV